MNIAYNMDCLEAMRQMPDNAFDLAVVDPPYGIGADWEKRNKGQKYKKTTYRNESIPTKDYFKQLMRVSKNQIIWGYNYFVEYLGPTNYLIVWDKQSNKNCVFHYSKAEIAFTSFHVPCNLISIPWDGYRMGKETGQKKIHPHQKPVDLYKWIFENYAKHGDIILDTHLGSGSSRIAAYDAGLDFVGYEIDKTYFDKQEERFNAHAAQISFFVDDIGG